MNDNLIKVTDSISERLKSKPAFGHKVKLVLTDAGTVFVDGTAGSNTVSNDDQDADLVLERLLQSCKILIKAKWMPSLRTCRASCP